MDALVYLYLKMFWKCLEMETSLESQRLNPPTVWLAVYTILFLFFFLSKKWVISRSFMMCEKLDFFCCLTIQY